MCTCGVLRCVYVDVHSGMNKRMWYFEVCVWCGCVF